MFYDITSDGHSLDSDYSEVKIDHTKYALSNSKILQNSSVNYLLKFAHKDSWTSVRLEDITKNKIQINIKNLYVDEILAKSHDPNLVFEKIKQIVSADNYFAFRIITSENIKNKIQSKFSFTFFSLYYPFHFLLRRVLPKLKGFRKICRLLRVPVDISKTEIIGRLIYKGFKIIDLTETNYETIIVAQIDLSNKLSVPKKVTNEGFLLKMSRLGKNGKRITVYKFRSMHPYAEYLQDYLHKTNGLDIGGKFKNDFRVSTGGRVLRKYWVDELPMLYNLLRGDIKLIGVRPISEHYFGLYPDHVQALRCKYKPGLLPPFYADMPRTFDEIVESEINYLNKYDQSPLQTDFTYLKKIIKNIVINNARSK